MIVANFPYGRLGNQLELAAHLIVFAELEKKVVSLQYLGSHADHFPYFKESSLVRYPRLDKSNRWVEQIIAWIISKLIRLNWVTKIDFLEKNEWVYFDEILSQDNFELMRLKKSWLCTLKVWRLRSKTKINDYRALIKCVFTPNREILDFGRNAIARLDSDVVIGIHIRWGDYKTEAPHLYHGIEIFLSRMLEAQAIFKGKKVGFVVCTEEGKDLDALKDLRCVFPKGDPISDLYALAQCDYLIASASTYSSWAAYWGEIGIFIVENPQRKIVDLNDFISNDLISNH
jgi:hypothetical protein